MISAIPLDERIRTIEVYASIQGESTWTGLPCVFVRLAGCNLRCTWCDSVYTFTGGEHRSIDDVVGEACGHGIELVEVTGGEPLAQRQCIRLLERLVARGKRVLLETSGSRDIGPVPEEVHVILDPKPPDSGEERANRWENVALLKKHHEVKFVLASRRDYEWSRDAIRAWHLDERCTVLLSPAYRVGAPGWHVAPGDVVEWMLADRLPARFQLQLHKHVWAPDARGV